MERLDIVVDELGNRVVVIPDIAFKNRQDIEWSEVEKYLERYVGKLVEITDSKDIVCIGSKFPDEYSSSKYTRKTKGARAKAKANASQGILEMIEIATDKVCRENHKKKHQGDAENGWYYYLTRFALPVYENEVKTDEHNVYMARIVVNYAANGKMYLYDIVDIKKEASNPLKITR